MGTDFSKYFEDRVHKKIICSILKTQAELIRLFDLPTSGQHISYTGDVLIWELVGSNISASEKLRVLKRKDFGHIKDYAVKIFKKNNFYNSPDLKDVIIEIEGEDLIVIYHKDKGSGIQKKNKESFLSTLWSKIWLLIIRK